MLKLLGMVLLCSAAAGQTSVSINVDLAKPLGAYKPITSWFGYDELNYTTAPHGRKLLRELHDAYPVPVYIRAHHLFTSGDGKPELKWSSTNVYTVDATGKPVYDFKIIDETFDTFRTAGVKPMVELGFMPEALASGAPPYYKPYPHTIEGSVQSPPKDYAAWGELCRMLTAHLVARYGKAEAATWYWEVWNEPNIRYWHGTQAEYDKLYDYAVAGVRSALPEARVGGPATTSPRSADAAAFLTAFLKHVAEDRSAADGKAIPLDFISFHIKGSPKLIGASAGQAGHVQMGLDKELTDADKGFAVVASFPQFRALPIILSEADPEGCAACSARENPANAYRNGPLFPVYTAATLKALFELEDRHHVNLLSMLTWSFEFEGKDYFQGFRTLATNGVDKPVMNVFRMAGMMSGQRVAVSSTGQVPLDDILKSGVRATPDIDAFATVGDHTAAVLAWNYHDDDVAGPYAVGAVSISGFPTGLRKVRLEVFGIDDTHSNAYAAWKAMGAPQQPTPAQLNELKQSGELKTLTSPMWVDIQDGKMVVPLALQRQATTLLLLDW